MWIMPEIILISRGNSELPTGLLLQVWTWVVYSVPHGTLNEGLRYSDCAGEYVFYHLFVPDHSALQSLTVLDRLH